MLQEYIRDIRERKTTGYLLTFRSIRWLVKIVLVLFRSSFVDQTSAQWNFGLGSAEFKARRNRGERLSIIYDSAKEVGRRNALAPELGPKECMVKDKPERD